jgi:hypothetical protein
LIAGVITGAFGFRVSAGALVDAEAWAMVRCEFFPADPVERAETLTVLGPVVAAGVDSPADDSASAVRELAATVDFDWAGRFVGAGRDVEANWVDPVSGFFSNGATEFVPVG